MLSFRRVGGSCGAVQLTFRGGSRITYCRFNNTRRHLLQQIPHSPLTSNHPYSHPVWRREPPPALRSDSWFYQVGMFIDGWLVGISILLSLFRGKCCFSVRWEAVRLPLSTVQLGRWPLLAAYCQTCITWKALHRF